MSKITEPFEVSPNGVIDETIVTFNHQDLVEADVGKLCKVSDEMKVVICADDDRYSGQIIKVENNVCSVKLAGVFETEYTGVAPAYGIVKLAASTDGKVKSVTTGTEYLVISKDESENIIRFAKQI
jgi:hypothetical protein